MMHNPETRPREKYTADPSGKSLSQAELLSIVLGSGAKGLPVHELAQRLLDAFPTSKGFTTSNWLEMKSRIEEFNERNPERQKEDHTRQRSKATNGCGILPDTHSASLFSSLCMRISATQPNPTSERMR